MRREVIIIVLIICIVIISNYVVQKNIQYMISEMSWHLQIIENEIKDAELENEKMLETIKIIEDIWEKDYKKMAYYLEHENLEVIEMNIVSLRILAENDSDIEALQVTSEIKSFLEYIKEKNEFSFNNIF